MVLSNFKFYSDFLYYKNGYYEHVNGEYIGSHEAIIVGWDDKGWITQNSFDSFLGNKSFFKVKFDNNIGFGNVAFANGSFVYFNLYLLFVFLFFVIILHFFNSLKIFFFNKINKYKTLIK